MKAGAVFEPLAEAGILQVKILMFPLDSHKEAKPQSISVVCDKKSFSDFHGGYRSDNQCAEGKALVEETVSFLRKKGISSTPTYIFGDGRYHSGLLQKEALLGILGIESGEQKKK